MRGEIIAGLNVQISKEVLLQNCERLVSVNPIQFRWEDIKLANHSVFRLNAKNEVVGQVRRVENPTHTPWEKLHEMAKQLKREGRIDGAYTDQGYLDPFTSLGMDEREAIDSEPKGVWRPGCVVYLLTRRWSYVLDPETGVATCTGDRVK